MPRAKGLTDRGMVRSHEVKGEGRETVETGIFYLSRLRGRGRSWWLRACQEVRGKGFKGIADLECF